MRPARPVGVSAMPVGWIKGRAVCLPNGSFTGSGKILAVGGAANTDRRAEDRFDRTLPHRHQRCQKVACEIHVAPPAVEPPVLSRRWMVDDGDRLDPDIILDLRRKERLKECCFERKNLHSIRARSFGKEQEPMACQEPFLKQKCLRTRARRIAFDKHGTCGSGQPPDAGPARDFGLRHEIEGLARIQCEDVEPTAVICDDRTVMGHRESSLPQTKPENAQRVSADKPRDMRGYWPRHAVDGPFDRTDQ